jgi:ferrous iron transport protein B
MRARAPSAIAQAENEPSERKQIVVIGHESVGKSQLVASLTNKQPYIANYRGSTVSCECYSTDEFDFIDTPGILYLSDSETTKQALDRLRAADTVLIVIKGTNIEADAATLLSLARGKRGAIVVTFGDKVTKNPEIFRTLQVLRKASGLNAKFVNARALSHVQRGNIFAMLRNPKEIGWAPDTARTESQWTARRARFDSPARIAAGACLLVPAVVAVVGANHFAELVDPYVQGFVQPLAQQLKTLSQPWADVLVGRYGLITMGPLMLVWALPTVLIYAILLGAYKASGLLDYFTIAIHPLVRPFGLGGRDVVRILMGFGCNVPAVISTRACSGCSRNTCISAIAFGSACSYQLGATLAVYSASGYEWLVVPYLLYLRATTLVFVRLASNKVGRSAENPFVFDQSVILQLPGIASIWRESRTTLSHFLKRAMPIFLVITFIASLLDWCGIIQATAQWLKPVMVFFNLPPDAVLPVIMASIRKDGILLFGEAGTASNLSPAQILTGTYLAGVLLPCMVTAITIAKERSVKFVLQVVVRQFLAAASFSLILAWLSAALI